MCTDPLRPTATDRVEVPVTADRRETVAGALWTAGALGVWERPGSTVAWFTRGAGGSDSSARAALALAADRGIAELAAATWSLEPDRDWQAAWKASIGPVRTGRILVVPSWHADSSPPADADVRIVLDPGRAFGSGHHATTMLCLGFLDDLAAAGQLAGRSLGDVGCGSGVLAIAGALLGARVRAVDVDPTAVEVTRANATRNGVDVAARTGSVAALGGPATVVVANLVTDVVVHLAADLVAAADEVLVVSGIAEQRRDVALEALERCGARTAEVRDQDGWIAARLHTD